MLKASESAVTRLPGDVFTLAVCSENFPIEIGNQSTASAGLNLEEAGAVFIQTRAEFDEAATIVDTNGAIRRIIGVRCQCRSVAFSLREQRLRPGKIGICIEAADLVANSAREERVRQRRVENVTESTRRSNDRGSRALNEHTFGEHFYRIVNLIARGTIQAVLFQRGLIDVLRVEVERGVERNQRSTVRRNLKSAAGCARNRDDARNSRRRAAGCASDRADVVHTIRAITLEDCFTVGVADCEHGVTAAIAEVAVNDHVAAEGAAVTFFGDLVGCRNIDTFEIALRDEVHNPGNSVRTVSGAGATGQNVHALE